MLRTVGITAVMGVMSTVAVTTGATTAEAAYRVAPPSGLHRVVSTADAISLDWRNARGATSYRVQVSKHRSMSNARVYRYGTSVLHVSPGVGTTFVPLRLFARPEVTELVVRSA